MKEHELFQRNASQLRQIKLDTGASTYEDTLTGAILEDVVELADALETIHDESQDPEERGYNAMMAAEYSDMVAQYDPTSAQADEAFTDPEYAKFRQSVAHKFRVMAQSLGKWQFKGRTRNTADLVRHFRWTLLELSFAMDTNQSLQERHTAMGQIAEHCEAILDLVSGPACEDLGIDWPDEFRQD